jgi:hypothetical protein
MCQNDQSLTITRIDIHYKSRFYWAKKNGIKMKWYWEHVEEHIVVLGTCWGTHWELWEQVGGTHWVQGASSHLL